MPLMASAGMHAQLLTYRASPFGMPMVGGECFLADRCGARYPGEHNMTPPSSCSCLHRRVALSPSVGRVCPSSFRRDRLGCQGVSSICLVLTASLYLRADSLDSRQGCYVGGVKEEAFILIWNLTVRNT